MSDTLPASLVEPLGYLLDASVEALRQRESGLTRHDAVIRIWEPLTAPTKIRYLRVLYRDAIRKADDIVDLICFLGIEGKVKEPGKVEVHVGAAMAAPGS